MAPHENVHTREILVAKLWDHLDQTIALGTLQLKCSAHPNQSVQVPRHSQATYILDLMMVGIGRSNFGNTFRRNVSYDSPS